MSEAIERHESQIAALRNHLAGWPLEGSLAFENGTNDAKVALNALLKHFEDTEPATAAAIKFGTSEDTFVLNLIRIEVESRRGIGAVTPLWLTLLLGVEPVKRVREIED